MGKKGRHHKGEFVFFWPPPRREEEGRGLATLLYVDISGRAKNSLHSMAFSDYITPFWFDFLF